MDGLLDEKCSFLMDIVILKNSSQNTMLHKTWVKVFRIIPEFRILRPTFHRKLASKH